jgi:hypothetical protein
MTEYYSHEMWRLTICGKIIRAPFRQRKLEYVEYAKLERFTTYIARSRVFREMKEDIDKAF